MTEAVAVSTGRRTGRTTAMLQALPVQDTPTVVVHTQHMADYVRRLAHRLRPDLKHPIRVRIAQSPRDCDYLRGCDFVVDHALLEFAPDEVVFLLHALARKPLTMQQRAQESTA